MKMKKRATAIVSALMSAVILTTSILPTFALTYVGKSPSSSYKNGAYYDALMDVTLTNNQRTNVTRVAKSQIGYYESNSSSKLSGSSSYKGSGNHTEYGRWYGMDGEAWCAMLVSWVCRQAGISTSVVPNHSYTETGLQWYKDRGQAYTRKQVANGTYSPQAGDLIYFLSASGKENGRKTNHVGIVTGFSKSKGEIYTVEGNSSNRVQAKTYKTSDTYIVYVCAPKYKETTGATSSSSSTSTSTKYFAKCSSSCDTITKGLDNIGVDSSYSYRKQIAAANSISSYSGTAAQNTQMLKLLKAGKLIKP